MVKESTTSATRTSASLHEFVEKVERAGFTIEIPDPEAFYSMTPEEIVDFAERLIAGIDEARAGLADGA